MGQMRLLNWPNNDGLDSVGSITLLSSPHLSFTEAAGCRCSTKWKPPELESHFNKTVCNFIKKWLYDRCFHVNIAKFLRTFKNTFFYRISPGSLCLYTCQLIPNKYCVNKYEVIEVVTNTCSTHIYFIPMSIYFM